MKRVNLAARILIAGSLALVLYRTSTGATETPAAANATATSSSSPEATASLPYFLMQYVSVPIPGGIRGLAPGTPVMVVTDLGNRLKVKADELEFEVRKDQVTHDPQIAARASQGDARLQQKLLDAAAAQQQQLFQQRQREQIKQQEAKSAQDHLRGLEQAYITLQQQENNLQSQIGQAQQPVVARYNRDGTAKYDHFANPLRSQLPLLRSRLRDIQREKTEARRRVEEAQRHLQVRDVQR